MTLTMSSTSEWATSDSLLLCKNLVNANEKIFVRHKSFEKVDADKNNGIEAQEKYESKTKTLEFCQRILQ